MGTTHSNEVPDLYPYPGYGTTLPQMPYLAPVQQVPPLQLPQGHQVPQVPPNYPYAPSLPLQQPTAWPNYGYVHGMMTANPPLTSKEENIPIHPPHFLVFATFATFILMMILWKRNPPLVQETQTNNIINEEYCLTGEPSWFKVGIVGATFFILLVLGSPWTNRTSPVSYLPEIIT